MNTRPRLAIAVFAVALIVACQPASRDAQTSSEAEPSRDLKVVTSGGFAAAYEVLAPQFEAATGITLVTSFGASSGGAPDSIPVRLERGEEFDVVILSRPSLDNLLERGLVRAPVKDLVRSSIGMAVREGASVPDISTPESFVKTLLDAESIAYSASASGTYLSTVLFPKLELSGQLEPKSRRILSERVASVVARGDVEIGFQQISEILPIEGVIYVGPIPLEYQRVTTFSIGITTAASNPDDAQLLVDFLSSADIAATIAATGLEPLAVEH